MNLDVVLSRTDSHSVLDEIVALRTHTSVRAKGVSQSGQSHYQFVAELDAKAEEWHLVDDQGRRSWAGGGRLLQDREASLEVVFPRGMPKAVQMLYPEALLMWGRRGESFYPMLIQEVGQRSLLITFEHIEDPAFRATAVTNRSTGIIEKLAVMGAIIILTEVETGVQLDPRIKPEFLPITDWIRPNY
ncbi:hypothetical protein [Paenarthrobacter aurescens]|uniref:hypothetical protein n=1 Tax=Paenarthrobacter aurescens TaxID=43663 RepID=UPI0021C1F84A|nr:hypothetical protein [Paenarthrobacter aurescens]MCT9871966.1 hypothetical protein [Paenarthrobacter aurescens]